MNELGYYKVLVKIEIDNGTSKDGTPKVKKAQEVYLVSSGSPQDAADKVSEEMRLCQYSWRIDTVKEVKLTAILD